MHGGGLFLSLITFSPFFLSFSTCSNTLIAPHLEVTGGGEEKKKTEGDNCLLS